MKILLETSRDGYDTSQCGSTLSVGDLLAILQDYEEDTPIYFSNDGGYTYGRLHWDTVQVAVDEEEEF